MAIRVCSCATRERIPVSLRGVRGQAGFTLLEILVALAILSVGVLGYVALQFHTMSGRTFAREMNMAGSAGIAHLEVMRTIGFEQIVAAGTVYRTRCNSAGATQPEYLSGAGYRIVWNTGDLSGVSANTNVGLRNLRAIYEEVSWTEKGLESSLSLATFRRP